MALNSQKPIEVEAIESLYASLFNLHPERARAARAVAELALADVSRALAVDDNSAKVLRSALGWAAFDYNNGVSAVGPGYLAHAVRWRFNNLRMGSEAVGEGFRSDVIEMRARGLPTTDELERMGAGTSFALSYEDIAGSSMFGDMEYPDHTI